jgi:hypothetical protein
MWRGLVERQHSLPIDRAGAKTDRRVVALSYGAITHHDSQRALLNATLIGMSDEAGVAHRGTFERVFVREHGSQKLATILRDWNFDEISHTSGVGFKDCA